MEGQPRELREAEQPIRIHLVPSPIWVRFLAGAADSILAGLLAFAIILVILIPHFFPETEAVLYQYAETIGSDILTDTEMASSFMENEALRTMIFVSQITIYSVFFLYFAVNEWCFRGSSFGKLIFRITTVRRELDQPLTLGTILFRSWLKTVFLLFLSPLLWLTFLFALFQKERRTVHDILTKTWVVD